MSAELSGGVGSCLLQVVWLRAFCGLWPRLSVLCLCLWAAFPLHESLPRTDLCPALLRTLVLELGPRAVPLSSIPALVNSICVACRVQGLGCGMSLGATVPCPVGPSTAASRGQVSVFCLRFACEGDT